MPEEVGRNPLSQRTASKAHRRFAAGDDASTRALELAEAVSAQALDDSRKAYDALYERVYRFATLLASGAGGAGVYALGKVGQTDAALQVLPLAALSVWWFVIVAALLLRGGASRAMKAGTAGDKVRERFLKHLAQHGNDAHAVWYTRWDQVKTVDKQAEDYAKGTSDRALTLDKAYWCLAGSPAVAVLAYLAALPH